MKIYSFFFFFLFFSFPILAQNLVLNPSFEDHTTCNLDSNPPNFDINKFGALKLKIVKFCILNGRVFWKYLGGILLKCVDEKEAEDLIAEFHRGYCGGHHFWKATAYKILRVGYY